jgi:YggT family protein
MFSYGNFAASLIGLLESLLNIYSFLIVLRAILSWFSINPYNRYYQLLIRATEPVLGPLRRLIPMQGIDISPIIAILLIDLVVKRLLIGLVSMLLIH